MTAARTGNPVGRPRKDGKPAGSVPKKTRTPTSRRAGMGAIVTTLDGRRIFGKVVTSEPYIGISVIEYEEFRGSYFLPDGEEGIPYEIVIPWHQVRDVALWNDGNDVGPLEVRLQLEDGEPEELI